jgi:hypothetical protein
VSGVDCCRVGFLPRHNVCQATSYDGRLVQVVAMLAGSDENPRQRQFSRFNIGTCHATIIDTIITSGHEAQQAVNEGTTNGLRQCCRDAVARSVFEQEFETAAEEEYM